MTGFDIDLQDKLKALTEIEQEIKRQVAERLSNYELTMVTVYLFFKIPQKMTAPITRKT